MLWMRAWERKRETRESCGRKRETEKQCPLFFLAKHTLFVRQLTDDVRKAKPKVQLVEDICCQLMA